MQMCYLFANLILFLFPFDSSNMCLSIIQIKQTQFKVREKVSGNAAYVSVSLIKMQIKDLS
jgi:hypothetical protein